MERVEEGKAEHQHRQAIQLFSINIFHDLHATVCVCSESSAVLHITLFARSFRRRFFAYHYAVNHPHTNIILS